MQVFRNSIYIWQSPNSSVVLLSMSDSNEYTNKYDNELLEELKQSSDVCRVIEINNRSWVE